MYIHAVQGVFAMYMFVWSPGLKLHLHVLGAACGPLITGWVSDDFVRMSIISVLPSVVYNLCVFML